MQINEKYIIYNFLDHIEETDYLSMIKKISTQFHLSFYDSETFVRSWNRNDEQYIFYFELMKKVSEIYNKNLESYNNSKEFWEDILSNTDTNIMQLLCFLAQKKWLGELTMYFNITSKSLIEQRGL